MNWNLTKVTMMAIIIAAIGIGFYYLTSEKAEGELNNNQIKTEQVTSQVSPTQEKTQETNMVASETKYKNGVYTAEGDYFSPGGNEAIDVKLTIKDNIVTDSEITPKASRPQSLRYQKMFVDGYKQYVVGKNINDVKLDKISGSSLTPKGFNDAIEKIKSASKA